MYLQYYHLHCQQLSQNDIVNHTTLKKLYLSWQSFINDYISDVEGEYDDNESYGKLYINQINSQYQLKFKINRDNIIYDKLINHNDIIYILYNLISSYKYPYSYNLSKGYDTIIYYDFYLVT